MIVTTTRFRGLTEEVASGMGLPGLRILEVGHPLGGTDEATILAWGDGAVERAVALFTGRAAR